ncbi:hypothetical protein PG984_009971 [Apiospora sp. TS-2023a]
MPSTTSLSLYSFHNAGLLTTTYTAPASCATAEPSNLMLGPIDEPDTFYYGGCSFELGNCYPSGADIDALESKSDGKSNNRFDYFSPGLNCPHDWTTVGVATKIAEGMITSSGPAFTYAGSTTVGIPDRTGGTVMRTSMATLSDDMERFVYAGHHALLGAMDRGETAILCCPSPGLERGVLCCPTLGSGANFGLLRRLRVGLHDRSHPAQHLGTTVSGHFNQATATGPLATETTVLPEKVRSELVAYTIMPMVALVHRESDAAPNDNGTETTDEEVPSTSSSSSAARAVGLGAGRPSAFQMAFLGEALEHGDRAVGAKI